MFSPFLSREAKELIFLIAEKPCPKTLDFLLKQGISPHTANKFQQTLLHLAAQAGQEQNVLCLIEHGANPNAQDLSKRTPLFLAVLQNHRTTVQLLLPKTDVTLTSIEQETPLHAAAFYGYTPLLQDLLNHPPCKKLIEAKDHDGKTPLHKAVWMDPKPDVVELLIAQGADPQALNTYDYTPLHWAAKHGHLKSVQILMEQKVDLHALNKNGDSPLDLAIRFGQDAVIHLFLGTTRRLKRATHSRSRRVLLQMSQRGKTTKSSRRTGLFSRKTQRCLYREKTVCHRSQNSQ